MQTAGSFGFAAWTFPVAELVDCGASLWTLGPSDPGLRRTHLTLLRCRVSRRGAQVEHSSDQCLVPSVLFPLLLSDDDNLASVFTTLQ